MASFGFIPVEPWPYVLRQNMLHHQFLDRSRLIQFLSGHF